MENHTPLLRRDVLDILEKRVGDFKEGYRQNIAILGDELLGKTTLLKNFLSGVADEQLICVYVEIVPFEFSLFCKRFLNSLLYNFLKRSQLLSTRETLENLIKRSKEQLPVTYPLLESFLAKLEKEKPELLFKELFSLSESFCAETKKRCIIIFDEFQNLMEFGIKNIGQELGKKIMFQKNALFIFSSSLRTEAKKILSNDLALLFGNFETVELQMFEPTACELLIKEKFGEIPVLKEFIDFLIHFTGGHPFYLKTICDEAAAQCKAAGRSSLERDILVSTLERLLFRDWGIFNLKFITSLSLLTLSRNKNDFIYILDAIALGKNRLKDLSLHLRRQRKEVTQKLNRLVELGIISKNGSFYVLTDRLMSFWLKFVHYEKLNALSPDYSEQASYFRSKIIAEIEEFINISKKDIADRMLDLFNLFEGDSVLLEKKRLQLSTFKELKLMRFENADLKVGIFGRSQDSLWLAAIKEDGIREHDVTEFIQLAKKYKHKMIKKIIIGLGAIDRNAKLLAKESRIMTWDTANLNSLFDLYGKPRIIK